MREPWGPLERITAFLLAAAMLASLVYALMDWPLALKVASMLGTWATLGCSLILVRGLERRR